MESESMGALLSAFALGVGVGFGIFLLVFPGQPVGTHFNKRPVQRGGTTHGTSSLDVIAKAISGTVQAKGKSATKHPCPDVPPDTVQELLEARRSIFPKDYTGAAVSDHLVRRLLDVGRWAPTHGKTEPWRFVCFAGKGKEQLLDATLDFYRTQPKSFWAQAWEGEFPSFRDFETYFEKQRKAKWLLCSHLVSVLMRRQQPGEGKHTYPEHEEVAAVACAVQNMHILATSMRIGSYWSSWFEHFTASPEGLSLHGLTASQGDLWMGVFAIGQSEKMDGYRATRKPVEEVSSWRHGSIQAS